MGLANGGFESGLDGWSLVTGGCDYQAWALDTTPANAHTGSNSAKASARRSAIGPRTWCGSMQATLTGLTAGDPDHDVSGFWRSVLLVEIPPGTTPGYVAVLVDGIEIGRFDTLQAAYTAFSFPFTPAGATAALELRCVAPTSGTNWRDYYLDDLVLGTPAMPSKIKLIRDAITAEIRKVTGIGGTGSDWRRWSHETRLPAAYTLLESEDKELAPTRSKEGSAHFILPVVLQSANPEDDFDQLRADIETQIEDDPSLGGLAMEAWVSGCGPFSTTKSVAGQVYVRTILLEVRYRHTRGTP